MAPTQEELLVFLQQAQIDHPHLTKEEITVLAVGHFAQKEVSQIDQAPAGVPIKEEAFKETFIEPPRRFKAQLLLPPGRGGLVDVLADTELPAASTDIPPRITNRKVVVAIFTTAVFLAVLAGTYLFVGLLPVRPTHEEMASSVITLRKTSPDETAEVTLFGKRLAGNSSFYNDKYQNKILEIVGVVESVERKTDGCLEATLMLTDSKRKVFRARFRFLPEQGEAIALARGAMAVIKGKYISYKEGALTLYPSVIVYNSAQPDE
jgi:hypothetical protein